LPYSQAPPWLQQAREKNNKQRYLNNNFRKNLFCFSPMFSLLKCTETKSADLFSCYLVYNFFKVQYYQYILWWKPRSYFFIFYIFFSHVVLVFLL
jgi:hypothetical protein